MYILSKTKKKRERVQNSRGWSHSLTACEKIHEKGFIINRKNKLNREGKNSLLQFFFSVLQDDHKVPLDQSSGLELTGGKKKENMNKDV